MKRICIALWLLAVACSGSSDKPDPAVAPAVVQNGQVAVQVIIPDGLEPGLSAAAQDLADAMKTITGASQAPAIQTADQPERDFVKVVLLEDDELGNQEYRLTSGVVEGKWVGITVEATTKIGAMYGLYHVIADMGVRYIHPRESYFPENPQLTLPWYYDGTAETPAFELRGFHEHTQHPIPRSDFILKPYTEEYRTFVSEYLRWLARNRQNVFTFHMLKTVDLEKWVPVMQEVTAEAAGYGIHMGPFIGFADQQQHAFKLVKDEGAEDGAEIMAGIDSVLAGGFDLLGFQIGTSEFTKTSDETVLGWIQTAMVHMKANHPSVSPYAWIHIQCSLEADSGGKFFHLPLQSDPHFGSFVHTTMFYTLDHPAPVYDCEDFKHQLGFMANSDGKRNQVFFPETAWWLGFDNNLPLAMPITGWSRAYDIQEKLPGHEISGHVTFTTGREWTYWQYDHHLTRMTWDQAVDWESYLDWIAPVYGDQADKVVATLKEWTQLQVQHFYVDNPLIYFYLAGELQQDEIGQQAGVLARRPKLSYKTVYGFDNLEFAVWEASDFNMLVSMLEQYASLAEGLPPELDAGAEFQKKLYREVKSVLDVYVLRIEHAIELYSAVVDARTGDEEAAYAHLDKARSITASALAHLQSMEADYRHPLEVLTREKESLTAYPFGYLYETSTAFFWTRRDDQLEKFLGQTFGTVSEEWELEPEELFVANPATIVMTSPSDPVAAAAIGAFIPRLLLGMGDADANAGTMTLLFAQDANSNLLPDIDTEAAIPGVLSDQSFEGTLLEYTFIARDSSDQPMGAMRLLDPQFIIGLQPGSTLAIESGGVAGEVVAMELVATIQSIGGIDEDGAINILKGVFGIDPESPLPETLPIEFAFTVVSEDDV